ncbi:unnamed protein product [Musa hybrid cultivar]
MLASNAAQRNKHFHKHHRLIHNTICSHRATRRGCEPHPQTPQRRRRKQTWKVNSSNCVTPQQSSNDNLVSNQATLTSMVLGFLGSGGGTFWTVTVSTPSWHIAEIASTSALSGRENLRMNLPTRRSIRRYLTPPSLPSSPSGPRLRSPLTTRTRPSSTWTLISPPLSPGMSTTKT